MRNLFFVSVLSTFFSISFLPASAQKHKQSGNTGIKPEVAQPLKFIEGIEIKREIRPETEAATSNKADKGQTATHSSPAIEKSQRVQFKYAQLLNCDVEAVQNIQLFNFIDNWWETRYSFGGTTKEGVDCSAFASILFSNVYTTEIPRTAKEQFAACKKLAREKLVEGDLVFFNTRGGVSHVGIYLGDGYFVHASTTNGVTINNLDDDYYSARFLGGGRISHVLAPQ